jgi:hypothetical protein
MCQMISCLVSKTGKVYAVDGIHSHSEIAAKCGIDEDKHLKYEFVLATRTLKQDFEMDAVPFAAKQSHDEAARGFFDLCAGTPARLRAYVKRGNFLPDYLRPLLIAPASKAYDEAVAPARKAYNEALATASKAYDEALATASKAYDEALATASKAYDEAVAPASKAYDEALATAQKAYDEAIATAWLKLFSEPANRIAAWRR